MSRTDAHRPYRVWLVDHPELALTQHHPDHRDCDLPDDRSVSGTRCRWTLSASAPPLCCCELCHAGYWRRVDTRRRRQRDRTLLMSRPANPDDWAEIEMRMGRH